MRKNPLPQWARGTIAVAGTGLAVYAVFKSVKALKGRKDIQATTTEAKAAEKAGIKASYTDSQYKAYADSIFNAWFQSTNIFDSVDEDKIYSVLRAMKNNLDWLNLVKAFGLRRQPIMFISFGMPDADLYGWLSEALSASEIAKANSILATNKITYKIVP